MAAGGDGDQGRLCDDLKMTLNHEDRLRMLSEGSFRCRPCLHCKNSDPLFIELQKDQSRDGIGGGAGNGRNAGGTEAALRLKCKRCGKPYALSTSSDEDLPSLLDSDADALDFSGVECCKCRNKEPACFSVSHYDNGHLRSITCLICYHGNTFHESDAGAGGGSSSKDGELGTGLDSAGVEFGGARIECINCPNTNEELFDVTYHPDGRIHKITCLACMHGNTFRNQPGQAVTTCNNQGLLGSWFSSAAQVLAQPLWSATQSLVQSALSQVSQQVSNNAQNNRPEADGLRQVAAGQIAAIGKNFVLELGDKYLKKLLPMIPDTAAKALTRNLSDVVSQLAIQLLAARQEKKKAPGKAQTPASTENPAKAKRPSDV